jgi:anti-anti-sigma factor
VTVTLTLPMAVDEVRVTPVSELTDRTVAVFMMELDDAVELGRRVVIDLRHVASVSPLALDAIAEANRYLRDHGGTLRIEHASDRLQRLLDDLGFARVLAPEVTV